MPDQNQTAGQNQIPPQQTPAPAQTTPPSTPTQLTSPGSQPTQPSLASPQSQPPKKLKSPKPCLITCLIIFGIFVILAILGWFVFRPMFFKWLCHKGSQEQGIIKIEEDVYYHACLRKYHIEK